jgi:Flp pilus assembly protein TadG
MLFLACLALAIDVGVAYVERRRVQAVADAAALAGAAVLTDNGTDAAILQVINQYVGQNYNPPAAGETRVCAAQWLDNTTPVGTVGTGARPAGVTGILVTLTGRVPTTFANVMGTSAISASVQGGAGYSPLDVMLVLDKSGSMDDDSCFLKGVTSPNPISLRTHFKTSNQCQSVSTGDGLSSSNCSNCKGTWSSGSCKWPGGSTMGSEVNAICGSVQSSSATCTACKGAWVTPPQPIDNLKTAAGNFVDLVQAQLAPTNPHIGLVSYSSTASLNVQLTATLSTVKSAIGNITVAGYTNCEEGLYTARVELTTSGRQRWTAVKAIVFLSDGKANLYRTCYTPGGCSLVTAKQRAISEAQLAGTLGIAVYTIGLGALADQDLLQQMAAVSGGSYLYSPTSADLEATYAEMFRKIQPMRLVK